MSQIFAILYKHNQLRKADKYWWILIAFYLLAVFFIWMPAKANCKESPYRDAEN